MDLMQIFMGFLGSLGFGVLFNLRRGRLAVAALGGLMSWAVFLVLEPLYPSESMRYFFAAAAVTVYSEVFARVLKTPTTTFLVTAMIPLIPGGALYYTMNYALNEQWALFAQKALYTLQLALALAVGIIAMTTVFRAVTVLVGRLKKQTFQGHFHHNM